MYRSRQQRLAEILQDMNLDALAINAGPSLSYLTGLHFHLMERPVVLLFVSGREMVIILPELEQQKLVGIDYPVTPFTYPENPADWPGVFRRACDLLSLAGKCVGTEPQQLRLLEYNYLKRAAESISFTDASSVLASLRCIKDKTEIEKMQKAVSIAQESLTATLPLATIGTSEKELANELVIQLLRHGSDPSLPFSPIVSTGPNGANPHASPSGRTLSPGDLLIIDWGATSQGYASDLTRTFAVGKIEEEYERIHSLVRQANEAGLAAAKPGATCSAVDKAARKVITDGGYGPFFTHRTGHGIGMECHEAPYIRNDNDQLLEEGMTFTIEPGIYLAGRNGVRIEDDIIITAEGAEALSTYPRNLVTIG